MVAYIQKEKDNIYVNSFMLIKGGTTMSKYYARMSTTALRDELDRLEEQLDEMEEEDLSSRAGIRNRIFYICDILCRRENAA